MPPTLVLLLVEIICILILLAYVTLQALYR